MLPDVKHGRVQVAATYGFGRKLPRARMIRPIPAMRVRLTNTRLKPPRKKPHTLNSSNSRLKKRTNFIAKITPPAHSFPWGLYLTQPLAWDNIESPITEVKL